MTKTFSPSEAALSVFELVKRQPQFVLRYCIIYALVLMATYALFGATGVGKALQDYAALAAGSRPPNPERALELLSPAKTGFLICGIFGWVTSSVMTAMALRKAVRDEDEGAFGLQFGKDEINLLVATLAMTGILAIIGFTIMVIGGVVSGGNIGIMSLVASIAVVISIIVGMRLSQLGVLTIAERRISVVASIAETKGQTWRFLGAYLLWIIIAGIMGIIAQSIGSLGAGALGVNVSSGVPASLSASFKPGWMFYSLIYGLASGLGNLGMICIGAYAWHQMRGDLPAPKTSI